MYLLYKTEKVFNEVFKAEAFGDQILIGLFDSYDEMCYSIGREVPQVEDFSYADDDGRIHMSEWQDEQFGNAFWKAREIWEVGEIRYEFERIYPSERELRMFLDKVTPVAMLDFSPKTFPKSAARENEQRFYDQPVVLFSVGVSPPDYSPSLLPQNPCYAAYIYAPTEEEALKIFEKHKDAYTDGEPNWIVTCSVVDEEGNQ